jgi:hypothetical protein
MDRIASAFAHSCWKCCHRTAAEYCYMGIGKLMGKCSKDIRKQLGDDYTDTHWTPVPIGWIQCYGTVQFLRDSGFGSYFLFSFIQCRLRFLI